MPERILRAVFILGVGLGSLAVTAQAQLTSFTVNTTSDAVVSRACETGAAGCSLRGAIAEANAETGSVSITFSIPANDPNCSAGVCTIRYASEFPALSHPGTSIAGPGARRLIIRPAAGPDLPGLTVDVSSGVISISGLTIFGVLRDSAMRKLGAGTLNLTGIVFSNGRSTQGAGLQVSGGTVTLTSSTIQSNTAEPFGGGAIAVSSSTVCNVINSTISGNATFGLGGAGILNRGALKVTNTTIEGNAALNQSAGASSEGGGILTIGGTVTVKSTIIAFNFAETGRDVRGDFISSGFNLVGIVNDSTGFNSSTDLTGTSSSPLNPRFDQFGTVNNGGNTSTVALLPDSPAIDKGSSSGLTGALSVDQRGSPRTRENARMPNAAGGDGTDIGAYERHTATAFDFDGDNRAEVGIFRPSAAEWWIYRSLSGTVLAAQFGAPTDKIVPADYTGDGKTDIAFWRPGTGQWFVVRSEDGTFFAAPFGTAGDIPVPADYDDDGKADVAVFRPSTGFWFVQRSRNSQTTAQLFGTNGDQPIPNDYDGDGRTDVAIYRPSVSEWWLDRTTAGTIAYSFGANTDKIVPGDYTGDGKTDVAFWRPVTGQWFVLRSENSTYFAAPFGASTDIPTPADYDADGKFDVAVFRPSTGFWFVNRTAGGISTQQFGVNGDVPLPRAFLP